MRRLILIILLTWAVAPGALAPAEDKAPAAKPEPILLSDMTKCRPAEALSRSLDKERWQTITYQAEGVSGVMIGGKSLCRAPDVTLPLGRKGWHKIYVGYWNPMFEYDGGTLFKLKLTGDPCFDNIREGNPTAPAETLHLTSLRQVFWRAEDLTGRDLVIRKLHGHKAYVAYVKLEAMGPEEVAAVKSRRQQKYNRRLLAAIDGTSFFHRDTFDLPTRPEDLLELVAKYEHSDVERVVWAVNYGHKTNYPSEFGELICAEGYPFNLNSTYGRANDKLRSLLDKGAVPEEVVAEHVHKMGLKFDIMIRPAINGGSPIGTLRGFPAEHPEFRICEMDGVTPVEKWSYAFPQVRDFMLSIIREAAQRFDVDGVCIAFVRGPFFMGCEKPVADAFRAKHNQDPYDLPVWDKRLLRVRGEFLTQFMRDARKCLDAVGKEKGRRIDLSAWVWSDVKTNFRYELDPPTWMKEKLLDRIIAHNCAEMDPQIVAAAKASGCKAYLFPKAGVVEKAKLLVEGYAKGVEGAAIWDIDGVQENLTWRSFLQVAGRPEELKKFISAQPQAPAVESIPVRKINGKPTHGHALWSACYSGG